MTTDERLAMLEQFATDTKPLLLRLEENRKEVKAAMARIDESNAICSELTNKVCGTIALIQADVTRIDAGV
jgi:hypothetical protein